MNKPSPLRRIQVPVILVLAVIAFIVTSTQSPAPTTSPTSPDLDALSIVTGPLVPSPAANSSSPALGAPVGALFFSAERNGRWEIYGSQPNAAWVQVTHGMTPARAPALTADGQALAFQSHKDGNWEIYVQRLDSGALTRLTQDLGYDGAPSWSPDGQQLAFESYRSDDLDIWLMNRDGSQPINLTSDERAHDYGPAWSPQGNWIAYTSWATGNKQIFIVSPDGKQHINLSQNQFEDEQPAWSPDGQHLAFVSNREGCERVTNAVALNGCQRREIYVADFDGARLSNVRQLTFSGHDAAPVWSPDGQNIAFVSPRPARHPLFIVPSRGGIPRAFGEQAMWIATAAWSARDAPAANPSNDAVPPLYIEEPIAAPGEAGHPYEMRLMPAVDVSDGELSSAVANSFIALRGRIKQETGHDFLSLLADMTRPLDYECDATCASLSWHKAGRAFDTRLEDFDAEGHSVIELVREDELGEVYWHLYLRAAAQDGSMGEPIKDGTWDTSYRARAIVAPEQGGIEQPPPYGYYVDMTELAREYGWERISSHDDPEFDWRSNKLAMEYWHYQKVDGLDWYQAMQQIYAPADLAYNLDWNKIARQWGVEEMRIFLHGVPAPPAAWRWFGLIPNASQP